MIFLSPGIASTPLFAAGASAGQGIVDAGNTVTDRQRVGATPSQNSLSADTSSPDVGRTDNPSQTSNSMFSGEPSLPSSVAQTGIQTDQATPTLPTHYSNQYLGQSLRAPMASGDKTDPDSTKNIFFKFAGPENKDVPAIWMWINPNQLTISHSKKIPEQVTRGGFVLFHWGDNLDEINANGITGSFARPDCPDADNKIGYKAVQPDVGLDRRSTWPYLRFMQLLALYRNNGIVTSVIGPGAATGGLQNSSNPLASAVSAQSSGARTTKEGLGNTLQNMVDSGTGVGGVSVAGEKSRRPRFAGIEIHYDDNTFTGFFNSFTWTERADEPFKFTFDFRFTVLNTEYNKVFGKVAPAIRPNQPTRSRDLLANFQIPRFNSI